MSKYETVIGLEVHAQLATKSKLFCACSTSFGQEANENVCPVCAGMPGVLPVLNKKAIEYIVRMGLALDCTINNNSIFARKNYFYPDLPKGYQTSQFEKPICTLGNVKIKLGNSEKTIGITRIHLEDDAGKNIHGNQKSMVDLNRAGTPLMEIVSEPDMRSAEEAVTYLKMLHSIVTSLNICDGNMEEGSFRCDANVSIRPLGSSTLGTRTELKNLNSFKFVQKAIEYEVERQINAIEDGEKIIQETRLFDNVKNITVSMRSKEEANDYRYFPDPDLLPIYVDPQELCKWKASQAELPSARKERYQKNYELSEQELEIISSDLALANIFEACLAIWNEPKKLAKLLISLALREANIKSCQVQDLKLEPKKFTELAQIIDQGLISNKIATDIFSDLLTSELMPEAYVKTKGLVQISDNSALEAAILEVLKDNPNELQEYKDGKTKLMSFFVGKVMRATGGKANPSIVSELLIKHLSA